MIHELSIYLHLFNSAIGNILNFRQFGERDKMKVIEAVIRPVILDEVKIALKKIGIEKIMVSQLVNKGRKKSKTVINMGTGYMVGLMSKIKVEIIAADELVGRVIETIGNIAGTEHSGGCRILIRPCCDLN